MFTLALVLISHEYGDRLFHGMLTLTPYHSTLCSNNQVKCVTEFNTIPFHVVNMSTYAFWCGGYIGNLVFLHICSRCFPNFFGILYQEIKKESPMKYSKESNNVETL